VLENRRAAQLLSCRNYRDVMAHDLNRRGRCIRRAVCDEWAPEPTANGLLCLHSVRNARMGSILDARHAGTKQARAAIPNSVAATAAKIAGSSARVP
jgi:hypothetical protein